MLVLLKKAHMDAYKYNQHLSQYRPIAKHYIIKKQLDITYK